MATGTGKTYTAFQIKDVDGWCQELGQTDDYCTPPIPYKRFHLPFDILT